MSSVFLRERTGNFLETEEYKQTAKTLVWWQAVDQPLFRAYSQEVLSHLGAATELASVTHLEGASANQVGNFHYVVETDIPAINEEEFNAWYNTEHLPGLSRVPGTISAKRYVRNTGSPRFIACYELISPAVMDSKEWLAIRYTAWSSRIRPMFQNTFRQLYTRIHST